MNNIAASLPAMLAICCSLMTNTSCGDIDPAVALYLAEQCGMTAHDVNVLLNKQAGFHAVLQLTYVGQRIPIEFCVKIAWCMLHAVCCMCMRIAATLPFAPCRAAS